MFAPTPTRFGGLLQFHFSKLGVSQPTQILRFVFEHSLQQSAFALHGWLLIFGLGPFPHFLRVLNRNQKENYLFWGFPCERNTRICFHRVFKNARFICVVALKMPNPTAGTHEVLAILSCLRDVRVAHIVLDNHEAR